MRVVQRLAQHPAGRPPGRSVLPCGWGRAAPLRAAQGHPPHHRGSDRPDGDPGHGAQRVRLHEQGHHAEADPADADRQVDRGQRPPPPLALQDAGLAAHHRQRYDGHGDEGRRTPVVEVEREHDDRGGREHHRPQGQRGGVAGGHHLVLDALVVRRGADPAGRGGLQPQREHVDDQEQTHDRGQRAVLGGPEQAGRDDDEAVGGEVHDRHGDRDDGAAPQGAPARGRGVHVVKGRRWPGARDRRVRGCPRPRIGGRRPPCAPGSTSCPGCGRCSSRSWCSGRPSAGGSC